jgi:hypothetical protein
MKRFVVFWLHGPVGCRSGGAGGHLSGLQRREGFFIERRSSEQSPLLPGHSVILKAARRFDF